MYERVEEPYFADVMTRHGFTRDGARALYAMLEDYEQETGIDIQFDPVALRCDYCEYASAGEAATDFYGHEEADPMTEAEAFDRIERDSGMIASIVNPSGHFCGYIIQKF